MFGALLAHNQEALHKRHLVYRVRVMSVGCTRIEAEHARNIPSATCVAPPEEKQAMFETCTGPQFLINSMVSASRWFHYTAILRRRSTKH
jgi:hypothetical protein